MSKRIKLSERVPTEDTEELTLEEQVKRLVLNTEALDSNQKVISQTIDADYDEVGKRLDEAQKELNEINKALAAEADKNEKTSKLVRESVQTLTRIVATTNAQGAELNTIHQQINLLNQDNEQLYERFTELAENRPNASSSISKVWYELPKFNGYEKPGRFLRQLEQYIRAARVQKSDFAYVINSCLTGIANDWWQIISLPVDTYQEFEPIFLKRFWNEEQQYDLRRKLEFGFYNSRRSNSMCAYAMRLIGESRDLKPIIPDREIIKKLARHFSEDIKTSIICRGLNNIDDFLNLLQSLDRIGTVNSNRNRDSQNKETENREVNKNPRYKTEFSQIDKDKKKKSEKPNPNKKTVVNQIEFNEEESDPPSELDDEISEDEMEN